MSETHFWARVPTEAIQDVHNGSFEGSGGFTLVNCTGGGRVTTEAHGGRYSCQVTPTSGTGYVRLTTRTQTSEARVMLAWVKGYPTKLTNGATDATPILVQVGANGWNRWAATFTAAQCSGQTTCAVKATTTVYVDEVLLYPGDPADGWLAYFDGDSGAGRRWLAGRYASASKQLAVFQGQPVWDGGTVQPLDDSENVVCELVIGMGVYPVETLKDTLASGKTVYRQQLAKPRAARLVFNFLGRSLPHLTEMRADWLRKVPVDRPFALLVDIGGTLMEGRFVYQAGLQGNIQGFQEKIALELEAQDERLYELDPVSTELTVLATPSASYLTGREEGVWRGYSGGPGVRGSVAVVYVAPDQTAYWGTENVGGAAYVQKWDGETVSDVCSVTGSLTSGPRINTLAVSPDGATLYVGGDYQSLNGVAGFNGVGKVTLATLTAAKVPSAGTGCVGGSVVGGRIDPTGLYWVVGGLFTSINGVSLGRFGRMDLATETWSAVAGAAFDAAVWAVRCATNGDYFVGGSFGASSGLAAPLAPTVTGTWVSGGTLWNWLTSADAPVFQYKLTYLTAVGETDGGVAQSVQLATGPPFQNAANVSWSAGGAGCTGYRLWRTEAGSSIFYFLREFAAGTTSYQDTGAVALDKSQLPPTVNTSGHRTPKVAWYDASAGAWKNCGVSGMSGGDVYALDLFPDQQTLVAGGAFASADGNTCGGVAYKQGETWLPLGTGMAGGAVYAVRRDLAGRVWAGGAFASADGSTLAARLARFDGFPTGVWQHTDLVPASTVWSVTVRAPDEILVGHAGAVTSAAAANTATHTGSADWSPRLVAEGAGTLRSVACYETGAELLVTHTLVANETVTIDPDERTVTSSVHGDILSRLRPGSTLDRFRLPSGASKLLVHMTGGGSLRATGRPANASTDKARS